MRVYYYRYTWFLLGLGGIMVRKYLVSQQLHKVANEAQFRAVCISALSKSNPEHVGFVITDTGEKFRVGRDERLMLRYYRSMNPISLNFCEQKLAFKIIPNVSLRIVKSV